MKGSRGVQAAALLVSLLLLLALAGCGGQSDGTNQTEPEETAESVEETGQQETAEEAEADGGDEAAYRVRFEELVKANTADAILDRHTSRQTVASCAYLDEEVYSFSMYMDREAYLERTSNRTGVLITPEAQRVYYPSADGEDTYLEVFFDSDEAYADMWAETQEYTTLSIDPEETLTAFSELDGRLVFTTEVTDGDYIRDRLEQDAGIWGVDGYSYEDGCAMLYTYTFDPETGDLLEIDTVLRSADGTETPYIRNSMSYDEAVDPKDTEFAFFYDTSDTSVLTLVFSPGTAEEHQRQYTIVQGCYWTVMVDGEEYNGDVYADPECTEAYTGSPDGRRPAELTLYIPAQA